MPKVLEKRVENLTKMQAKRGLLSAENLRTIVKPTKKKQVYLCIITTQF